MNEEITGGKAQITGQFTPEEAAQLMDELWNNGVRPSNGAGSNATMAAKDAHLEDLRRLVFESKE